MFTKKIKMWLISGITIITLIELYFSYKVLKDYRGIYPINLSLLFLLQPIYYWRLFNKKLSYFKTRLIGMGVISIILPLVIYFTLPNYTYQEGQQLVIQNIDPSENVKFIDLPSGRDTIPVINDTTPFSKSKRAYYYVISSTEGEKYFAVLPQTGKVTQLKEKYWGDL